MAEQRPDRRIGIDDEPFWEYTKNHELRLQKCDDCGQWRWPPAPICAGCLSENSTWTEVEGKGTIKTWVTFHRQYFPELPPPVNIILVELTEGPLFISNPVGLTSEQLKDGMAVELTWLDVKDNTGEFGLPQFRPV